MCVVDVGFFSFSINAEPDGHYQRIHLSSAAEQQAENDLITMTLLVRKNDQSSPKVAEYINETMGWAIELVKKHKDIVVRSENYQISPIYKKERFIEWRGSQNLILKSHNILAISEVSSILLKRLQIQSQSYSLSFSKKEQIENDLIKRALTVLKNRARIIQNSFNADGYRIVNVNINTQSSRPIYRNRQLSRGMIAESMMSADVVPVASESGQSVVKVSVNGEIELVM